jgi:hypothetical protein
MRGFNSAEARNGARSIFERSHGRLGSSNTSVSVPGRGPNPTRPAYSRSGRVDGRMQVYNKEGRSSALTGRSGYERRLPAMDRGVSRTPGGTGSQGVRDRNFGRRPEGMIRQSGMSVQRPSVGPSVGGTRSFNSSSQGGQRSYGSSPQAGARPSGSSSRGAQGFSGSQQGRAGGGGSGHGGPRF